MEFNQPRPSTGEKIDLKALVGRLLLVYPTELRANVPTVQGEKEALIANVVVLDGPAPGEEVHDAFIFPGGLIGQLKHLVGAPDPALGRLAYGDAKPGQNAPYQLAEYTAPDEAAARAWVHAHPRGLNQPAPAAQHAPVNNYYAPPPTNGYTPPPAQTPPAAAAPPAGAPAPGGLNLDTIRTLLTLNLPDHEIAATTGATPEQIAAIRNLPVA
jgi:hypothetical protein